MKTRKRNNKKIRKTKHKKKRKTMRIKVIKKKYNKTRKMKGGQTISQREREKRRKENRQRTLRARKQAKKNKDKIVILTEEINELKRKVDAKNTILTIIKRQRGSKIKEINELNNKIDELKIQLNKSGNEKKFCKELIENIQNLKIISGDETTELADGMYQIMKTGKIIIPHETNKEDQKDVWIKLDLGEQSLKSTPSAKEKNIQTNHTIHSLSDMIDFSNKTTLKKDSFIKNLNEALRDNTTDSMREEEEKKEQEKINNMKAQLSNFSKERKLRPAPASAPARQSASRPAAPKAPKNAWGPPGK
tara:strand:+ start:566 stop:1480 length:915 start_codon:yes stop_codon:yes gene_type:complete